MVDGDSAASLFENLADLFEQSAADGTRIREVVGKTSGVPSKRDPQLPGGALESPNMLSLVLPYVTPFLAMTNARRVFLSYARTDGEAFATALRRRLQQEQPEITIWAGPSGTRGDRKSVV